jgi:hypothetical protein
MNVKPVDAEFRLCITLFLEKTDNFQLLLYMLYLRGMLNGQG